MSLVSVNTPSRTFNSVVCDAVSCSQLRYEYTRKDGTFTTVSKTAGDKLILDDWSLEGSASIGDRIFVYFDDGTLASDGQIVDILSTPTRIETDIDYSSATTARAGFCNDFTLRPNYRVKATIDEFSPYEFFYTDGANGLVVVNMGAIVKDLMLQNNITYTIFTMNVLEVWDGSSESESAENDLLVTLSQRQILETFGANLWDLMLQYGTYNGLVLSKIPEGENVLWEGWKRTASFLIDPLASGRLTGSAVSVVTQNTNQAKVFTSSINVVPVTLTPARIYEYDFSSGADFGTDYYTKLYGISIPPSNAVTNNVYYQNAEECKNPIMIEWLNSYGAWEQWLFETNQVFFTDSDQGIVYESGTNDYLENITGIKKRIAGGYTQRIQLQATYLTQGQLRALAEIKFSSHVRMFLSKDGTDYVEAVVYADYSDQYDTKGTYFDFKLSLEI